MMRRRSSSKCSSRLILPNSPSTASGLRLYILSRSAGFGAGMGIAAFALDQSLFGGHGDTCHRATRRQDLVLLCPICVVACGFRLDLQLADLRIKLRLELIARALEFIERFAELASDLRQLPRPKQQETQEGEEDHLRHAEIHA